MKRKYFLGMLMFSLIITSACKKEKPIMSKGFIKYFGGIDVDAASEARQTPDGGYVMIGSSNSFGNKSDISLIGHSNENRLNTNRKKFRALN